jgi:putative membrane protein
MRLKRRSKPWRGLIAGALGGLAASFLMGPVHALAQKAGPPKKKQEVDPTEKVAAAVSENVLDHTLTRREKKAAASVVHYIFGTAVGAVYGVAAETIPAVRTGFGSLFGAAVWLGAHVIAVPALGLAAPITKSPMTTEAGEFGAHLVYGTVSEGLRRAMRSYVLR